MPARTCAFGLSLVLLSVVLLSPPSAQAEDPQPARVGMVDAAWLSQFSRRAEQLSRVLLSAMAAARAHGQADHARCFDRALSELHGVERQVAFHGARVFDPSLSADVRNRHARALALSQARLAYVAQSTARCSSDGSRVEHGRTRVETTFEP